MLLLNVQKEFRKNFKQNVQLRMKKNVSKLDFSFGLFVFSEQNLFTGFSFDLIPTFILSSFTSLFFSRSDEQTNFLSKFCFLQMKHFDDCRLHSLLGISIENFIKNTFKFKVCNRKRKDLNLKPNINIQLRFKTHFSQLSITKL